MFCWAMFEGPLGPVDCYNCEGLVGCNKCRYSDFKWCVWCHEWGEAYELEYEAYKQSLVGQPQ